MPVAGDWDNSPEIHIAPTIVWILEDELVGCTDSPSRSGGLSFVPMRIDGQWLGSKLEGTEEFQKYSRTRLLWLQEAFVHLHRDTLFEEVNGQ